VKKKIIYKLRFIFWLNVKKGYKKFIKKKGLEFYRSLISDLINYDFNIEEKKFSSLIYRNYTHKNKILSQYIIQKYMNNFLFYAFCFFLNKNKKMIIPIPKEMNHIFTKKNISVNFFLSNIVWKLIVSIEILKGIKSIFLLLFRTFIKSQTQFIKCEYSIIANIVPEKLNLPENKIINKKFFNLINWCEKEFNEDNYIFFSKKKIKKNYYETFLNIEDLFSYNLNKYKVLFFSFQSLIFIIKELALLRWHNLILFSESVKAFYVSTSAQKTPRNTFFIWTNNCYRPLWSYEVDLKKSDIKMLFLGLLNGLILKNQSQLTSNDWEGLSICTWPTYYVWHDQHKKYIQDRILIKSKFITLKEPTYFKDSDKILSLPKNSIALFAYENNKQCLGFATLANYDIENNNLLKDFHFDIINSLKKNNYFAVIKRKRHLSDSLEIKKNKKIFSDLQNESNVIFVDPDHSVEKIVNMTKASICIAFTSPGYITKFMGKKTIFYDPCQWVNINDPSRTGIEIVNSKYQLDNWLKSL
jgi:hypothetical protein